MSKQLSSEALGRILFGFISRCTDGNLEAILVDAKACTYAGANLGTMAQVRAQQQLELSVHKAVAGMIENDRDLIRYLIERETD